MCDNVVEVLNFTVTPEGMPQAFIHGSQVTIDTAEGRMTASPGDWIIKGVQGEFYPCKPAIFKATYEPMDAEALHAFEENDI
jgi:hypothetical protein